MNWKKAGLIAGVITGVFLGVKYIFPVMLPFFFGWILAEAVHPWAAHWAGTRFGRKLHMTEGGIGAVILLCLTFAVISAILLGAEYLTKKIGDCVKYYPVIKAETGKVIERCCVGAEHITGIPAGESSAYIYTRMHSLGQYLWKDGKGMDTAVDSVKGCVLVIGMLMVGIVSSILFLQEREKIRRAAENREFYKKLKHLWEEMLRGAKAYLKAQVKIMGFVCLICIPGLWALKVRHFLGFGIVIGMLDMLPVLGTGTFLIPWGILTLFQGNTVRGVGFFVLYLITAGARQFLEPRFIGNHVGVSPLLVLLSVYLGIFLYGGFGFILGPVSGLLLYGIFREWDLMNR